MKKTFPGYYRPTEEKFKALWKDCLFVLDTNVLLDIYRYSIDTREEFIKMLDLISNRLWIPHQVALEYQNDRNNVIIEQERAYDKIGSILTESLNNLKEQLKTFKKHPLVNVDEFLKQIERYFSKFNKKLISYKKSHPDWLSKDDLRDKLTSLFNEKVGPSYEPDQLEKIFKEGEKRYQRKIPPGFSDEKKPGNEKYGDLVLWYQIKDKAKTDKKNIIFVTNDTKEDWWQIAKERKTIGPRPELIEEMLFEAKVNFYMYGTERFMEFAEKYLQYTVKKEAIDEVREVKIIDYLDKFVKQLAKQKAELQTNRGALFVNLPHLHVNAEGNILHEDIKDWTSISYPADRGGIGKLIMANDLSASVVIPPEEYGMIFKNDDVMRSAPLPDGTFVTLNPISVESTESLQESEKHSEEKDKS